MLSIVLSFITTCLLKQKSHFRQQQKLLKVLQDIESDSARLSWVVSPTEEQVLDPEVRTLTCEAPRAFSTCLQAEGKRAPQDDRFYPVGTALTAVNLASFCPGLHPPPQHSDSHVMKH